MSQQQNIETIEQHTKDDKNEKGEQENKSIFPQRRTEEHRNTPSEIKNAQRNQQLKNHTTPKKEELENSIKFGKQHNKRRDHENSNPSAVKNNHALEPAGKDKT